MEYMMIGKIINTHGIKGDLKVYPYISPIEMFSELDMVYLGEDKKAFEVDRVKYHKEMVLLKLKEYDNINDVLYLKDELLYTDENNTVELPKDSYFIHDLIDCEVYDTEENYIGHIKGILQNSGNDVYVVKDKTSDSEYLIPAVTNFIKEVNVLENKIIIDPIEGMIE